MSIGRTPKAVTNYRCMYDKTRYKRVTKERDHPDVVRKREANDHY